MNTKLKNWIKHRKYLLCNQELNNCKIYQHNSNNKVKTTCKQWTINYNKYQNMKNKLTLFNKIIINYQINYCYFNKKMKVKSNLWSNKLREILKHKKCIEKIVQNKPIHNLLHSKNY